MSVQAHRIPGIKTDPPDPWTTTAVLQMQDSEQECYTRLLPLGCSVFFREAFMVSWTELPTFPTK